MIRKRGKRFPFTKVFILLLIISGIISIGITICYTIPKLSEYIGKKVYISPLAKEFLLHEALGSEMTPDVVKTKLKEKGFLIKEIHEYDTTYIIIFETGEKILFSKEKSLEGQISSLQLISSRFTIEGKHFTELDLRFDRPVVVPK